jgi:hypothetical protein
MFIILALFRKLKITTPKLIFTLVLTIVIVVFIASAATPTTSTNINALLTPSGVKYPEHYRTRFHLYTSVQRPDGTIRDLYINDVGVQGLKYGNLPPGTIIVIEGFHALNETGGKFLVDQNGRYIKGDAFPMIHVREKRSDWSSADFASNARNGLWNSGSFELQTGQPFIESLSACFHCHNTAPNDFLYSMPQLEAYLQSGEQQYQYCRTTGRTACE